MLGPAVDEGLIRLPHNGWRPRAYQTKRWHFLEKGGKRAVAISHRRAGKHEVCLHWSAIAAHLRVGVYWHMLPETNQERKAVWDAGNPHSGQPRINEAFPRELRETDMAIRFPDLPVMMVTAYGDDERRRRASDLGASEFLAKPVDFDALKVQLRQLSAAP